VKLLGNSVYVIGHKNPDTDSICSAIAYAYLKKTYDGLNAIPARLGALSRETSFVLRYFNVEEPVYIENVYTQIMDIKYDKPLCANLTWPMLDAWQTMQESSIRTVCVVDDKGTFMGLVTLGDLAKVYLSQMNNIGRYQIPIGNAASALNGEIINAGTKMLNGEIIVATMSLDEVIKRIKEADTIIVGDRPAVQRAAIENMAGTLIIVGGKIPDEKIIELAKKNNVNLIVTPYDAFDAVKYVSQSIPLSYIMKSADIISFEEDDYIHEVTDALSRHRYRNFPVLDKTGRVIGLLSRRHVLEYEAKKVILVDHNEFSQTVEGINEANILEIIDHHRLGGIMTDRPIFFKNQPVGCTATIVYGIYKDRGIMPPPQTAGIMCAAILSDTLAFKSPTCTPSDIEAAEHLAKIADINIENFAAMMFKEGTELKGKTPEEIFFTDFKEFNVDDFKIGISQINVMSDIGEIKYALLEYMRDLKDKGGYDILMLMLTNIIKEGSEIIWVSDYKNVLEKAFAVKISDNSNFYLPGVVSRKTQVIPPIAKALKALQR